MGKAKKIVVGAVVTSLIVGAIGAGLNYARLQNIKYAVVCPVGDLDDQFFYQDEQSFDGRVTSNVSQNITLGKDLIVDKVYVSKGEKVKAGQELVSFDTTITEMKLNIERLKLRRMENNMNDILYRLNRIRNGAPLTSANVYGEDYSYDDDSGIGRGISNRDDDSEDDSEDGMEISAVSPSDGSGSLYGGRGRPLSAFAVRPVTFLAAAVFGSDEESLAGSFSSEQVGDVYDEGDYEGDDGFDDEDFSDDDLGDDYEEYDIVDDVEEDGQGGDGGSDYISDGPSALDFYSIITPEVTEEFSSGGGDGLFTSGENGSFNSGASNINGGIFPWLTPTPLPGTNPEPEKLDEDYVANVMAGFIDGDETFHLRLDWNTVPYTGSGTENDPFVYLCSYASGAVKVTGGFLNLMAGYNPDGEMVLKDGGYWYQLEFHSLDRIADYGNRKKSCIGYYLMQGSTLTKAVDRFMTSSFTVEGASQYPDEEDEGGDSGDMDSGDLGGDSSENLNMTRNEVISYLQKSADSVWLDIREKELAISKLEKVVNRKVIYAKIDGVVTKVGDQTNTGSTFMTIKSNEGYFITGAVSELLRDQMTPGTKLTCRDWFAGGTIEAEVVDLSDFSVSSSGGSMYGEGNPNVSYYKFTASLADPNQDVSNFDSLTISIQQEADAKRGIVLDKAFVRQENGNYYVMWDQDGVLAKRYIKVKQIVNFGTSVLVGGGISKDDLIAFPYGENAAEGTPTRLGTSSELRGGDSYF